METTKEEQQILGICNWMKTSGKELLESGMSDKEISKLFREELSVEERRNLRWNLSLIAEELAQEIREEENLIN